MTPVRRFLYRPSTIARYGCRRNNLLPQGNGAVPIGLSSNTRPRRRKLLPILIYWATLGLMAGTAGLTLQLMRDIAARAAPVAPLSRAACHEAAQRAPAFKATRLRACLAKVQEAGL
jgi:hypothetical protein